MDELTLLDRLLNSLSLKPVDRIPALSVTQTGTLELMEASGAYWPEAHRNAEKMARLAIAAHRVAGLEAVRVPFGIYAEAEALGCRVDYHEDRRDFTPTVASSHPEPEKVEPVDPKEAPTATIIEATKILKREVGGDVPLIAGVTGPFTLTGYIIGMDRTMMALMKEPEIVKRVLDVAWRFLADYAGTLRDAGADVICLVEPVASTIGPKFFKEFNLEYLRRIVERLRHPTVLHVCGNSLPILELIVESGVNGISIDQKVDVGKAKERVKGRACIIGNIDPVGILVEGSPETVEAECKSVIEKGVDILAPGCGLSPYTPTANLKAMVEAAKKYGRKSAPG